MSQVNVTSKISDRDLRRSNFGVMRRDGVVGDRLVFTGSLVACLVEKERIKGVIVTLGA